MLTWFSSCFPEIFLKHVNLIVCFFSMDFVAYYEKIVELEGQQSKLWASLYEYRALNYSKYIDGKKTVILMWYYVYSYISYIDMYQCCNFNLVWGPALYNPNTSRVWLREVFLWASAPLYIAWFCAIKVLHLLVAFLVWDTGRCSCLFAAFDASAHTDANVIDWWLSCKSQRHTTPCMARLPASRFFKRPMDQV